MAGKEWKGSLCLQQQDKPMKDKSAPREPRTGEARFQREMRTNPRPVLSPQTKETKRSFANSEARHLHPTNMASVCISAWARERQLGK